MLLFGGMGRWAVTSEGHSFDLFCSSWISPRGCGAKRLHRENPTRRHPLAVFIYLRPTKTNDQSKFNAANRIDHSVYESYSGLSKR